jgi:hypothetical protein
MNLPKVLVGSPVSELYDYCFDEFVKSRKSLTYKKCDMLFVDNSKNDAFFNKLKLHFPATRIEYDENVRKRMVKSRNLLRKKIIDDGYDYFLNLDQDIIPPNDIIERLVAHKKPVISGLYFVPEGQYDNRNNDKMEPVSWINDNGRIRRLNTAEQSGSDVVKIWTCGTGCILIHRSVLERIEFRFDEYFAYFDDMWFSRDLHFNNIDMFIDTGAKCRHLVKGRNWKWADVGWW